LPLPADGQFEIVYTPARALVAATQQNAVIIITTSASVRVFRGVCARILQISATVAPTASAMRVQHMRCVERLIGLSPRRNVGQPGDDDDGGQLEADNDEPVPW